MTKICDLNLDEMPREKLVNFGPEYLSSVELLAIILRVGIKGKNVIELSREILKNFNITQVSRKTYDELISFKGIKHAKATQIVALFELSRRLSIEKTQKVKPKLDSSKKLFDYIKVDFMNLNKERIMIVLVNSKNIVIRKEFVNFGSINYSIIDISNILKKILNYNASGFFLIHNHPSGDLTPSTEDIEVTSKIFSLCSNLNIRFLDHIIVSDNYYSFFDNNKLT